MSKFSLNNLDKSTWESFKFQEITERISLSVDPTTTELEVYVGLEHIDAEDIHIRRFGKPSDVTGNKLKCFRGDVIFGKRRAYQRKAAIADFDGICSAHSFVFRAKADVIEPELFPFFLHSDQFMHRAVDISVGGLSPTINWGDLKDQEFLLPPKEEQKKLAELLWSMDDVIEKEKRLLESAAETKKSLFQEMKKLRMKSFDILENLVVKISSGGTPSREKEDLYFGGHIPWVKTKELNDGLIYETSEHITTEGLKNSSAKLYPEKTILLAMYGVTVGKIGILSKEMSCNQACCAIIVNENKVDVWFLFYYLISMRDRLISLSVGSAQPNINAGIIRKLKIPLDSIENQKTFVKKLIGIDEFSRQIMERISVSQTLQKSLINQIF